MSVASAYPMTSLFATAQIEEFFLEAVSQEVIKIVEKRVKERREQCMACAFGNLSQWKHANYPDGCLTDKNVLVSEFCTDAFGTLDRAAVLSNLQVICTAKFDSLKHEKEDRDMLQLIILFFKYCDPFVRFLLTPEWSKLVMQKIKQHYSDESQKMSLIEDMFDNMHPE